MDRRTRYQGCLLGGAIGDAVGAPVEFLSHDEIVRRFGPDGIDDYAPAYGRIGAITDDTQMTLFTAEGLLRARSRWMSKGIVHIAAMIDAANLRWFATQGERPQANPVAESSWLSAEPQLHQRRAPGNTCLAALAAKEAFGRPARNDSKGCGTVMKTAPLGLFLADLTDERLFSLACDVAALTHGHPLGIIPAGWLALLIAALVRGDEFDHAVAAADKAVGHSSEAQRFIRQIEEARALARTRKHAPEAIERIGGGWTADEAVAIAVFAVERAGSFADAVLTSVNHSGDSDSTGAITGNIYGTIVGAEAIPKHWIARLEMRDIVTRVAEDLFDFGPFGKRRNDAAALEARYPGF